MFKNIMWMGHKSLNPVHLRWSIVLHRAKAYWKFLFWHKLCNVGINNQEYTKSLFAKYHRSGTVLFSFDTRYFMRTLLYVCRKIKQIPILKFKIKNKFTCI